jgi:hypothetical protein
VNYKVPKGVDANLLSLEEAMDIVTRSGDQKTKPAPRKEKMIRVAKIPPKKPINPK